MNFERPNKQRTLRKGSQLNVLNNITNTVNEFDGKRKRNAETPADEIFQKSARVISSQPVTSSRDNLLGLNDRDSDSEIVESLRVSPRIVNHLYANKVVTSDPRKNTTPLKLTQDSVIGNKARSTAVVEKRTLTTPCRIECSPLSEYETTPGLQYRSHCPIRARNPYEEDDRSFTAAIRADGVHRASGSFMPQKQATLMSESVNLFHFHGLDLEELPCNTACDFMPLHSHLSGVVLGRTIDRLFEVARILGLRSELIHQAVDFLYHYLSRITDITPSDLVRISVGALSIACKWEGCDRHKELCPLVRIDKEELKHAEYRLILVIDFCVTKINAVTFRDRYMSIDTLSSDVRHLSSFILDMVLHCYTLMLLPASKRAAAALWLSRLIDRFHGASFQKSEAACLRSIMDGVWPDHYRRLTGYDHLEVSALAFKMHAVVLALLDRGTKSNSPVNACAAIYSTQMYENLTGSYELFSSKTLYFASLLYCDINGLQILDWLEPMDLAALDRGAPTSLGSPGERPQEDSLSACDADLVRFDSGYTTGSSQ